MGSWKPFVELKTSSGTPIMHGELTVTPEAQALIVRLPYMGFVWNRPVAVVVQQEGRRERIPIIDVTRAAVMATAVASAALSLIFVLAGLLRRQRA